MGSYLLALRVLINLLVFEFQLVLDLQQFVGLVLEGVVVLFIVENAFEPMWCWVYLMRYSCRLLVSRSISAV